MHAHNCPSFSTASVGNQNIFLAVEVLSLSLSLSLVASFYLLAHWASMENASSCEFCTKQKNTSVLFSRYHLSESLR